MLNSIKHNILFILQNAKLIDFLAYGWVFLAFIFIVLLGIFVAIKSWWQIGFLFILAGFLGLFAGNYYANKYINENLRPVSISKINTKQLQYVDALMVDFNITNNSNYTLNVCKIELGFYLGSKQSTRNFSFSSRSSLFATKFASIIVLPVPATPLITRNPPV